MRNVTRRPLLEPEQACQKGVLHGSAVNSFSTTSERRLPGTVPAFCTKPDELCESSQQVWMPGAGRDEVSGRPQNGSCLNGGVKDGRQVQHFRRVEGKRASRALARARCRARSRSDCHRASRGSIDSGTSEIGKAIAADELDLYLFEGLKPAGNRGLHITSTRFDGARRTQAARCSRPSPGRSWPASGDVAVAYLGRLDVDLAAAVEREIRAAGFEVRRHDNPALQGRAPENICNRGQTGRDVQLELSRGLREQFFESLTSAGRLHPKSQLELFAAAVRRALLH